MAKLKQGEKSPQELWEDYDSFLSEIREGNTDRAKAVLSGVFIEQGLTKLLVNFMIDENDIYQKLFDHGPLKDFYDKIEIAYHLGLISKQERQALHAIREIRNKFAHGMQGISFDTKEIKEKYTELVNSINLDIQDKKRADFHYYVKIIIFVLDARAKKILAERCQKEEDFTKESFLWGDPPPMNWRKSE